MQPFDDLLGSLFTKLLVPASVIVAGDCEDKDAHPIAIALASRPNIHWATCDREAKECKFLLVLDLIIGRVPLVCTARWDDAFADAEDRIANPRTMELSDVTVEVHSTPAVEFGANGVVTLDDDEDDIDPDTDGEDDDTDENGN